MAFNNRTYVILNVSEINNSDFSELLNNNIIGLPKNVDGSKAIVKYIGNQPSFLNGKTTYTHQEIMVEMSKPSWIHTVE